MSLKTKSSAIPETVNYELSKSQDTISLKTDDIDSVGTYSLSLEATLREFFETTTEWSKVTIPFEFDVVPFSAPQFSPPITEPIAVTKTNTPKIFEYKLPGVM